MNTFTLIFLGFLLAGVGAQWLLVSRHVRHIGQNRAAVPAAFRGKIPLAAHQKAADYTRAKAKTGLAGLILGAVFILLWTLAGGLQGLDAFWRAFGLPAPLGGTLFMLSESWFYHGLGVAEPSSHMALTLFIIASPAFTFFLQPLFSFISRQHEFEADDFAAGEAHTENLITALVNLYRENANTLTPDPLYSAFHDSHPPAPIRIAHLKGKFA